MRIHPRFVITVVTLLITIRPVRCSALDGTRVWTRIWGSTDRDSLRDATVDDSGSVYAVGDTYGQFHGATNSGLTDFFLSKYTPGGSSEWTRIWGCPSNDYAYGVCTGATGKIYVGGHTEGEIDGQTNPGLISLYLAQVQPDGTRDWSRIWGGEWGDFCSGIGSYGSNTYVCGYTSSEFDEQAHIGNYDFCLSKHRVASRQWSRIWGYSGSDYAEDVAVDAEGSVYVAGHSTSLDEIYVCKYSSEGVSLWSDAKGGSNSHGYAVAVDGTNAVYVAGRTESAFDGQTNNGAGDLCLLKYTTGGTHVWTRIWGSTSNDSARSVAVDDAGYLYVAGITRGEFDHQSHSATPGNDLCLSKFSPAGERLWSHIWGSESNDSATAVSIASPGYLIVGGVAGGSFDGETCQGASGDAFLTKMHARFCIATTNMEPAVQFYPYSKEMAHANAVPPYAWRTEGTYSESLETNTHSQSGSAQGWNTDDDWWTVDLPFAFGFYGGSYTQCFVDSNGKLRFDVGDSDFDPSTNKLVNSKMIAVLWRDLSTTGGVHDIYLESTAQSFCVRWDATYLPGGQPVQAAATLMPDGEIRLSYGEGNSLGGVIGISAGDGTNFLISSKNQSGSMSNSQDIVFEPVRWLPPGLALSTNGVISGIPTVSGSNLVNFVLEDGLGNKTNKEIELVVLPNDPPVINSNAPPAAAVSVPENTNQLFEVFASDPEGSNLIYSWTWNGGGVGSNDSQYDLLTAWGQAGSYTMRVDVSDGAWSNVWTNWTVTVLSDNDGDGMPNVWENLYGLNAWSSNDYYKDPDGDTFNNLQEYWAGTVPTNGEDYLQLWPVVPTNSALVVEWVSASNRFYHVERCTNLQDEFSAWVSNMVANPPTNTYVDTNATGPGPYFYRIKAGVE